MGLLDVVLIWMGIGLIGGIFFSTRDINKGKSYTVGHIMGAVITSFLIGPFTLLMLINFDKVIIKGKEK